MNFKNIEVSEFEQLMSTPDHVVLDVRSPQELVEGSIPDHVMINMFEPSFMQKIEKLDKSKAYLVYCRSGNRSGQTCAMMSKMGFPKLYNLNGGIGAWNQHKVKADE
ncbi:rhodanese-like domain-containing protein [Ekhidna sp.]|uniref:rhodanese-like domain-containing protein n=1 Tax=Ekhidna sp. TaxID=2608089 RepID=UPI003CCC3B5B